MSRRRSRLETINTILALSMEGIRKTHIMYRANMSHKQLNKFLEVVLNRRLLTKKGDLYFTSERGRAFIATFREIQSLLNERDAS